jgi:hypothetical protein
MCRYLVVLQRACVCACVHINLYEKYILVYKNDREQAAIEEEAKHKFLGSAATETD